MINIFRNIIYSFSCLFRGHGNNDVDKTEAGDIFCISDDEIYGKTYERYRSYVVHEDSLINWRISWFLFVQVSLFSAFWVCTNHYLSSFYGDYDVMTTNFFNLSNFDLFSVSIIPIFGFASGLVSICSINAAEDSIFALDRGWNRIRRGNCILPPIIGGGDHRASVRGAMLAKFFSTGSLFVWLLVFIFIVISNWSVYCIYFNDALSSIKSILCLIWGAKFY